MPERTVIVDTGPLVAVLLRQEPRHGWSTAQFEQLPSPFYTCDAVIAEAFHLLARVRHAPFRLLEMLESGAVVAEYQIMPEVKVLQTMIRKYEDLPMSLADACLVRMAELRPNAVVLTLDHHFSIYRKNGAEPITTITP